MSFNSGFEQALTPYERDMNAFALKMAAPLVTVLKRDKSGKPTETTIGAICNQEPCYEELEYMRRLGFRSADRRKAALDRRKELNNGVLPVPSYIAQKAICEAWQAVHPRAAT